MASFLDFDNPEIRTGLSLLALGQMPKSQGFAGLLDIANARDTSRRMQAKTDMENAMFDRQKQEWMAADQAAQAAAAQRAAIPGLFKLGPSGEVEGFDARRAIELGLTPKQIEEFANVRNVGRSEVARTVEGLDEQGRPTTFQFDKFGNRVGDGLQQWKAPISVNQGDKTTFVDAVSLTPKQSFAMGMSPEARDASARGWASNALARERLNLDKNQGQYQFSAELGGYVPKAPGGQFVPLSGMQGPPTKAPTEGQAKALLFGSRMLEAGGTLDKMAKEGYLTPSFAKQNAESVPLVGRGLAALTNMSPIVSEQEQQIEQAQRDFINAVLRRESGAVISDPEFENARKQYFPQFGDSEKVIAQKKKNRETATQGILYEAGPHSKSLQKPQGAQPTSPAAQGGFRILSVE